MQSITDGIYYQDAYAGVVLGAIISPHGTLLIDSPLKTDDARSWKSILLTQSRGMHRVLVNLDQHTDRTIGNRYMDQTIMAHKKAADVFDNRSAVFKGHNNQTGQEWEKYPEVVGSRWIEPNITFTEHLRIYWGDMEILLDHRPGPSPSAIWVEVPSKKSIFVGDAVVVDQPPFLALADIPAWLEILELLQSDRYENYTIISGRSGPVTAEDVGNQHTFLKSVLEHFDAIPQKTSPQDEVEKMVPDLISKFQYPSSLEHEFENRLRHGLQEYYQQHFVLSNDE